MPAGKPQPEREGLLPDLKVDGRVGLDPGLDQRSTPPPPESLPSLLLQREPADRPRPRPQARPPVSPRLHATPTDPTCAGTVRASCVLATTSGQAKHRARAPQGHIQQGRGLVSHPQAWHGAGATRPAERTCERESGMPTPSREPVHGNQGCLHPAGFSEQGLCLFLCLRPPPAWPQGWRKGEGAGWHWERAERSRGGGSPSLWTKAGSQASRGRRCPAPGPAGASSGRHERRQSSQSWPGWGQSRLQVGGRIPPPTPSACRAAWPSSSVPRIVYDAT